MLSWLVLLIIVFILIWLAVTSMIKFISKVKNDQTLETLSDVFNGGINRKIDVIIIVKDNTSDESKWDLVNTIEEDLGLQFTVDNNFNSIWNLTHSGSTNKIKIIDKSTTKTEDWKVNIDIKKKLGQVFIIDLSK